MIRSVNVLLDLINSLKIYTSAIYIKSVLTILQHPLQIINCFSQVVKRGENYLKVVATIRLGHARMNT